MPGLKTVQRGTEETVAPSTCLLQCWACYLWDNEVGEETTEAPPRPSPVLAQPLVP